MTSLNKHIVMGRLGATPELKKAGQSVVTDFSIATTHSFKDRKSGDWVEKTNWINCEVWGKPAEIICKNWAKGDLVFIEGRIETDKFKDGEGVERYKTKTIQEGDFKLMSKKKDA